MMKKQTILKQDETEDCPLIDLMAVRDSLQVLSGTWKLPILISLIDGNKRFTQIAREVEGISDKMLSKELKELELNKLVKRSIYDTFPPTVEYSVTQHTSSLKKVIAALRDWGKIHRKEIMGNK